MLKSVFSVSAQWSCEDVFNECLSWGHFTWLLLGYLTLGDDFVIVCSFNHLVIDVEMWLKLANVSWQHVGSHNFYQLLTKGFKSQSSFTVHHRVNLLCFFSHLAVPHHPPQFDNHCSKPTSMLVYLFDFCSWLWVWWFTLNVWMSLFIMSNNKSVVSEFVEIDCVFALVT